MYITRSLYPIIVFGMPDNKQNSTDSQIKNKQKISRRNFISLLGMLPIVAKPMFAATLDNGHESSSVFNIHNTDFVPKYNTGDPIIIPPKLKSGDTVAFAAPASPVNTGGIAEYVRYFKAKGCRIYIADSIKKQCNNNRYFAAPDEERAAELNALFANSDIKAIICGRGGYGVMRTLNMLDYSMIRCNPKIIMGYSDITALLLAIYRKSGIITYHGPVASSNLSDAHRQNMDSLLFNADNAPVKYGIPSMKVIAEGTAQGILQGGNLTLISSTFGTDYEIDLSNSILFVEDVSILAHEFDRMLTQLIISNKLSSCKAVVFGMMKGLERRGNFFPNRSYTILEVMEQLIKPLGIPCVYNIPFGHIQSQIILPIGMPAALNTKETTIELYPNSI